MKRFLVLCFTALLSIIVFSGCGGSEESSDKTEFILGTNNVEMIDPANEYQGWGTIRYGVGETLFMLDENLAPVPNLVADYAKEDDNLTWNFTIKEGITFHNGNICDAVAVKGSLERLIENNERAAGDLLIDTISADGLNLTIVTSKPNPTLLNNLCDPYSCIVDASVDTSEYSTKAIGTGPYKVVNYTPEEKVELIAYDGYWKGTPAMESVVVRSISDASTLSSALQSGEIDAAYGIPYSDLDTFNDSDDFRVSQTATSRVFMLYFYFNDEFMKDQILRDAISMAVDKDSLGQVVLSGAGTATSAAFPSNLPYGDDKLITNAKGYDFEGAKKLLAENGYADSDNDGILEKNGKPVELRLVTYGRTGLPEQAEAVQSVLTDLGLSVSYKQYDAVEEVLTSGEYSICVYAFVTAPVGDAYNYLRYTMGTDESSNFGKYSNEKIDSLLQKLHGEFNMDKRADLAVEIQQLALKDSAYCYLTHLNMALVMKSNVVGLEQSPTDYYIITAETDFSD